MVAAHPAAAQTTDGAASAADAHAVYAAVPTLDWLSVPVRHPQLNVTHAARREDTRSAATRFAPNGTSATVPASEGAQAPSTGTDRLTERDSEAASIVPADTTGALLLGSTPTWSTRFCTRGRGAGEWTKERSWGLPTSFGSTGFHCSSAARAPETRPPPTLFPAQARGEARHSSRKLAQARVKEKAKASESADGAADAVPAAGGAAAVADG
jgi:hypothetical protein